MSKTNPKEPKMIWTRSTDKYGRSCHTLYNPQMRAQASLCRLPKQTAHLFPAPYLANDWKGNGDASVTYHKTLKLAKAYLEGQVA